MTFPRTDRTTASRERSRVSYDRAAAYAIIDEAYYCHLGFVVDGEPRILPTLHVRIGDMLYLHGSTGSRPLLAARAPDGLPVCVTVTHLDGLVLARSQFHHSANYRSVVAHGRARLTTGTEDKRRVLTALVERVGAGRAADTRPPTARELAETAVLALPLTEVSVKARTGAVSEDPADLSLPHWAGVVPLRLTPGRPEPDVGVAVAVPGYLRASRGPWLTAAAVRGDHVTLEPLDLSHVEELFSATRDVEVWRHRLRPQPASVAAMSGLVREALQAHDQGARVPWVLRCAVTGEVIGTTSYHAIDEANRSLAIGYIMLGRRWWRTGVDTEAELLLLERAFDKLGAVRVEWYADTRDERAQRAIDRLGAGRDGVLRRHRRGPDGTWRDSVLFAMTEDQWPAARSRLRDMLRRPVPQAPGR